MITITGCSNTPKKSKTEIEGQFSDFMNTFKSGNYDFLYDKEGDTSDLSEGDLGSWVISSYMYENIENQSKKTGILLVFNKNLKKCRGYFMINDDDYPVIYENNQIQLIDQNTSEDIKTELSNFKLLFDVISLDENYLHSLKSDEYYYNYEVPLYGTSYYLPTDDKNIKALKAAYPNFPFGDKRAVLEFEGTGSIPWNTISSTALSIVFEAEPKSERSNEFSARMGYSSSEKFDELFIEE